MKKVNFLSRLDVGRTLAMTVGSPSAHRRGTMLKHVAFLLLFLFAGFGQMWGDEYERVTNLSQLSDGDQVILVKSAANNSSSYALSTTQNSNNRGVTSVSISNSGVITLTGSHSVQILTLKINSSGKYGFHTGSGYLAKTGSNSNNYLTTNSTAVSTAPSGNCAWTPTLTASGNYPVELVNVNSTSFYLQFNGTTIASSYKNTQTNPCIFKKKASCSNSVTVTTPSATNGTISGATSVATCSATAADRQVTVTVTPSSGYAAPSNLTLGGTITPEKVSGPTSNGAGAYTYVYQFAQNANGSTSFSATCPELQKYEVSFSTGTGNSTVGKIKETTVGGGITLPSGPSTIKCASDGWEFAGWSETEITSESSSATLLPTGNYKPASDITLYAVYRKGSVAANATTVTYTLNGNWTTNNGNWTVIDGALDGTLASNKYGISSGSTSASSPVSITDISSITFSGTKSGSGAGTVAFYYGSGNSWTLIESKSFGTSLTWSPSPNVTGYLKCVFTRTNGNIYMASIGVTGKFPSYTYISSPDCCIELGTIYGSVSLSQVASGDDKGKLKAEWQLASTTGIGTLQMELWKKGSPDTQVGSAANVTISTEAQTKLYANPDYCATYYVKLVAAKDAGTYCTDGWTETSGEATTIGYAITLPANGTVMDGQTELGTVTASASRACAGDQVTLSATPTSPYTGGLIIVKKTSDDSDVTSTYFNAGTGKLTMPAFGVTISATFTAPSAPSVSATGDDLTETTLAFGEQEINTTSSSKTFTISGLNLTGDVTWVKGGTNADEFTVTSPTSATIAQATASEGQAFTVTFTPTSAETKSATLTFRTANEDKLVIALTGTGVNLYTVTLNLGGGEGLASTTGWTYDSENKVYTQKQASSAAEITLPEATLSSGLSSAGWSFAGWKTEAVSSKTGDAQTFVNASYEPKGDVTLYAVYKLNEGGTVKDEIDLTFTGQSGTSYGSWSSKNGSASDAVYAGSSAGGNSSVQLRSTNNSGIISTTSGGKAKKVTVTWNSNTVNDRTLDIYGKNTAYSATNDLYSNESATQGTKLGSIVNGTSTEVTITDDYAYIGLRSKDGAMYLDKIDITWSVASYSYFSDPSDKVSITYNANTGESAPAKQENIAIGTNPTVAGVGSMAKTGHTFSKWNTKADGTGTDYSAGGTITGISSDMTLYAIWTKNSYTISVTDPGNGNSITAPENNASIEYGAKVTLTANPANTHWSFTSWSVADANEAPISLDEEGGVYSFNMPASNVTVSATFTEAAKRTVNFYINGGNAVQSEDVYVGETPSAPSAVAPECFGESNHLAGWATTPWTGTDDDATPITAIPAVVSGEGAINYHAVFAKGTVGNSELVQTLQYDTWTYSGSTTNKTSYRLFHEDSYIESAAFDLSRLDKVVVKGGTFGGDSYNSLTIGDGTNVWANVTVLGKSETGNNEFTDGTALSGTKALRIISNSGSTSGNGSGIRISKVEIYTRSLTYSNYMTTCQSDLGAINGTVGLEKLTSGDNAGKLQASWTMASKDGLADNGIIIKIYKDGETPALVHTSSALSKDATSYVWTTAPDYCSEYYATLTPVRVDATYKEGVEQGQSANNCVVGAQYTYTGNYSHVAPKEGETVAENSCSSFSVEFEGTESYTLPTTISVEGVSSYTWESGVLSFDKADVTGNVSITINGVEPPVTTLSATPNALDFGTPAVNESVTAQKFRISGVALSAGDITITSPNVGFTVSPSKLENIPAGNLEASAATEITVTPVTTAAGEFNGNITISGGGASTTVALTMEVKEQYTVNWYVNGTDEAHKVHSQIGFAGTDFDEVPNDFSGFTDCSDYDFVGWKEGVIEGGSTTTEPSFATVGTTIPEANKNYFAVFAKGVSGGKAEGSFDLSSSNTNWVATSCVEYFNKPYGMKTANAKVVNNSIADFASYANTAEGISIKVNCFQNGGTTSRMTVSLVDADGNAIAGTGKEFTPTNASAVNGAEDSEVTYSASEVKNKNAKGYMMQLTTKDKNVLVLGTSYEISKAKVYSEWYTSCPHITNVALSAGSAANGSISFEKGGSAVTSVRTDGGDAVEVDVIASIDEGYELTGLTLTSEDVTGATKNEALTKITIPAGEEGTLTVTPTITLIPKYSITFANGGADGGSAPTPFADQYAGTPITLPANTYTYTDHKFDAWLVTYGETELEKAAGETFTMPAANVTITAQWIEYVTCAVKAHVNGALVTTKEVQSETVLALSEFGTPDDINGYTFAGWALSTADEDVTSIAMLGESITPEAGVSSIDIYAVFSRIDIGENVTDIITAADLAATSTGYVAFTDVQRTSAAKYAGATAKNSDNNIQIHSNSSPYKGIISTVSGGILKNISVTWGSGSNTLDVYASNTAYSEMGNLFDNNKKGTKVTFFTATGSYDFTDEYSYIGIRSYNNAIYLSSVSITWQPKNTYYTTSPVEKVKITFNVNGGQGGCQTTTIVKGSKFTICENAPTKPQSDFAGWNTQVDGLGTAYVAGTEYTFNENVTLYAQWNDAAKYTVTYNVNGSEDAAPTIDAQYAGDQFAVAGAVTKEGYTFKGWLYNGKLYKVGKAFVMPAADVEFVANWKKNNISTEKMTLVTDVNALVDGLEFALGCRYGNSFAMAGDLGGNKYMASVSGSGISFDGNIASFTSDVIILIAEQTEDGWKIRKDATNYLTSSGNSNDDLQWDTQANATIWTISFNNGQVTIKNSSNKQIQFNSTTPRFKPYAGSMANIQMFSKATVVTANTTTTELGHMEEDEVIVVPSGKTLTIDEPEAPSFVAQAGATVNVQGDGTNDQNHPVQGKSMKVEIGGTINVTAPTTINEVFYVAAQRGQGNGTKPTAAGKITGADKVRVESPGQFDFTLAIDVSTEEGAAKAAAQWHDFSVPFPVNALTGVYGYKEGEWKKLQNEVDYAILDFHGDYRANGNYSWQKCRGELTPGKIYSLTVNGDIQTFRFMKTEAPYQLESQKARYEFHTGSAGSTKEGWNGLGNSKLDAVAVAGGSDVKVYVLVYDSEYPSGGYKMFTADQITLMIGSAFLVQSTANDVDVSFTNANSGTDVVYYAPARNAAKQISEVLVTLSDGRYTDNLYLSACEDATNSYQIGRDVVKMFNTTTPAVPTLYTTNYNDTKLASEYAPLNGDIVDYNLTLFAPKAGEHTIAATQIDDATVYLTREGMIIWNLSDGAYTADLEKGNNAGYGIRIVKAPKIATGIENGESLDGANGVQKVIIDEHVYILRGEKLYDVNGKLVK